MRLLPWLVVFAGLAAFGRFGRAADPSALWHIVNDRCVPHEEVTHDPAPCSLVDLSQGLQRGYAVLKDIRGIAQFLLMPTARIAGIESPEIITPDAPNYWAFAWQARHFVEARLARALPRDAVSLAINSRLARTQDQLHIHIDCVRPDINATLNAHLGAIGPRWVPFPVPLAGHSYRAMRVIGEELGQHDPFRLLAEHSLAAAAGMGPEAAASMGDDTLVVVGATFPDQGPGFVILSDRANLAEGDRAWGEELQDHSCAIANGA